MPQSDAELVGQSRAGRREAYDVLIGRYQRPIYALACMLLGDRFEAQDIAQEAFLRAWLNLDLLSDPAKFAAWLRRIVFGVSIDWLRTFRPNLFRLTDAGAELELFAQPASAETALAALETLELRQRVWDAVANLPARYRLPLTLYHLDGLSHAKVAQAIGVEESTVRSLVTRGRQKLKPMLVEYAAEEIFNEQPDGAKMLHITDGESVAGTLRQAGIPGDVRTSGDLLYEGPAPAGLSPDAWREVRAQFIAAAGYRTIDDARRYLEAQQRSLEDFVGHDETVIWMDYRLSDQLILMQALDWFSRQNRSAAKLSLICAGRYRGIDRFIGLGQLTPDQLASLADTRAAVKAEQLDLGRAAWAAFTSPDPREIERFLTHDTSALPFLAAALRRHLEQFPSTRNGLSRTENQALIALRDQGAMTPRQLFCSVQQMEEQIFMGDLSFFRLLRGLARLIGCGERVEIAELGRRVLKGEDDFVRLNGIDRWLGGVHLKGRDAAWRWDAAAGRLSGS